MHKKLLQYAEPLLLVAISLLAALALFAIFVALLGYSPAEVYGLLFEGGFGSAFAWQNTLLRASPLILTGLAVAIPAQAGMVMIGGEGTLALGALLGAAAGIMLEGLTPVIVQFGVLLAGALAGAFWSGISGWLRNYRGVNETISSLLLSYIGIALLNYFVEGPLKDPASLNKPSTRPLADSSMIANMPGIDVHYGLLIGVACAMLAWLVLKFTTTGFAMRIVGGNPRAAMMAGLRVNRWIVFAAAAGGACAGLAGAIEVVAVQGSASASIVAGYGYAGILVAFIARQNPLAIIPVAIMLGGINAAGGMLQRRLGMPDASVLVLQGLVFMMVLTIDTLRGRLLRNTIRLAQTGAGVALATGAGK